MCRLNGAGRWSRSTPRWKDALSKQVKGQQQFLFRKIYILCVCVWWSVKSYNIIELYHWLSDRVKTISPGVKKRKVAAEIRDIHRHFQLHRAHQCGYGHCSTENWQDFVNDVQYKGLHLKAFLSQRMMIRCDPVTSPIQRPAYGSGHARHVRFIERRGGHKGKTIHQQEVNATRKSLHHITAYTSEDTEPHAVRRLMHLRESCRTYIYRVEWIKTWRTSERGHLFRR